MATPAITLHGVREAIQALETTPRHVRQRHLRIAMNAGMGVFKRAAVRYSPQETGLLRKSLVVKVTVPGSQKKPVYGLVGPRRGFKKPVARNRRGKIRVVGRKTSINMLLGGERVVYRNPARYAHLAERHQSFIGRAQAAVSRRAVFVISARLGREVEAEAARQARPVENVSIKEVGA